MDASDKLDQATLGVALNAVCGGLAEVLLILHGKITKWDIEVIPHWAFEIAVDAGWLPEPDLDEEPDWKRTVNLGVGVVEKSYLDSYMSIIRPTIEKLEPYDPALDKNLPQDRSYLAGPSAPTSGAAESPKSLIDRWRDKTGHTLETLAEQAGVSIATLYRIRAGTFRFRKQRESLKAVAAVIDCEWRQLISQEGV